MRDFTADIFRELLKSLQNKGYEFITYEQYCTNPVNYKKLIILRHDVDKKPFLSVNTARIENELGIKGTYYFRIVPSSNDAKAIQAVKDYGHEIGYHYEDLTLCKGNHAKAIKMFEENLNYFREYYPVSTICMHGSPMSKYDNRSIWKSFNYKDFDLVAEPYFDLDFTEFFYITDTGRRWDGDKVSVRDKVNQSFDLKIHSTNDFIKCVAENKMPDKIMITTHPQRWTNRKIIWMIELLAQNTKNLIKKIIVKS